MPEVTLITRKGCHLCDVAKSILESVGEDLPFRLEVLDMDKEPSLPAEWSEQLPVVLIEGTKRFKFRIEERRLRRLLKRAGKESWWRRHPRRKKEER